MTELDEIALPGEGNDRAFRSPAGNIYRARVVLSDAGVSRPVGTLKPARIAPTRITLTLSLALLDDELRVVKAGNRYRIFDAHEITITPGGMEQPGLDVAALVEHQIADRMAAFDTVVEQQARALDYLGSAWGIAGAAASRKEA